MTRWAPCHHEGPRKREAWVTVRRRDVTMEAEVRVMGFDVGGRAPSPGAQARPEAAETRRRFSWRLQKEPALPTPVRRPAPHTEDNKLVLFQPVSLWRFSQPHEGTNAMPTHVLARAGTAGQGSGLAGTRHLALRSPSLPAWTRPLSLLGDSVVVGCRVQPPTAPRLSLRPSQVLSSRLGLRPGFPTPPGGPKD